MHSVKFKNAPGFSPTWIYPTIIGLLIGLYSLSNAAGQDINGNNGWCFVKKADKLQVAFVLDRTSSYAEYGKKLATSILPKVVNQLKNEYKEVQYALTTFADYTNFQGPKNIPRNDAGLAGRAEDDIYVDKR